MLGGTYALIALGLSLQYGIARIMNGETREGEGDKAAALTLDPEVADQFAVYGIK